MAKRIAVENVVFKSHREHLRFTLMKLFHGTSYANYKSILKDKCIKFLSNENNSNAKTNGLDEIFNYSEKDIGMISFAENPDTARQFGSYSALASLKRGDQGNMDFVVLKVDSCALNDNGIPTHPVDCLSGYDGLEWIVFRQVIPADLIEEVVSVGI